MAKIRICGEISLIDDNGTPCDPAGVELVIGETDKEVLYDELIGLVGVRGFLSMTCLDEIIDVCDFHFITPEEFDRKYEGCESEEATIHIPTEEGGKE